MGKGKDRRPLSQQSHYGNKKKQEAKAVKDYENGTVEKYTVVDRAFGEDQTVRWTSYGDPRTRGLTGRTGEFTVMGCDCDFCKSNRGNNMSGDFMSRTIREMQDEMVRSIYGQPSRMFDVAPGRLNVDDAISSLQRAEQAARAPIEEFIVKVAQTVKFDDIAGNEFVHQSLREAIEFPIKHQALYEAYGKKPSKGVLLYGAPGCGKTMFGKAASQVVASLYGTKDAVMLAIKAPELQTMYVGQTEQLIRQIFAYARAYSALHKHPLVIFIDEADAILPSRDGLGGRRIYGYEESQVATFLAEMDGFEATGAFVILATNRPHAIDSALLRDGRIDRRIEVKRPRIEAARQIFDRALIDVPLYNDIVSTKEYSAGIPSLDNGMTPAEVRSYFTDVAMEELFSPLRHLVKVKTDKGTDFLCLSHVVTGAMIVGLVERAKAKALQRDMSLGRVTGIMQTDILNAVDDLTGDCRQQPDPYALREFAQLLEASVLEVDVARPEIKFTGTLQ